MARRTHTQETLQVVVHPGGEKQPKDKTDKKEIRGYMALRNNVQRIKLHLWKEVKPLEYFLVDLIIDRTIAWRQKEARIKIEDFVASSGKRNDEVYSALKRLQERGVINRRKEDHYLYFSLREEYFGGLLIKRHQDALLRRKRIKVVVNNLEKTCTEIPGEEGGEPEKTVRKFRVTQPEISGKLEPQVPETIEENVPLKTLLKDISKNINLKNSKSGTQNRESYTLFEGSESGARKQFEDAQQEKEYQLEQLAKFQRACGVI